MLNSVVKLWGGGGGSRELARLFAGNKLRVVLMIVNNLFILYNNDYFLV